MTQITLYSPEARGLKLGPGVATGSESVPDEVIVFADGYATIETAEFPDWERWASSPGTPPVRSLGADEAAATDPDGFTCPECGRIVKSQFGLNSHLRSHRK